MICLKCLQKDPRVRYTSALALADDLQRFSEGKPIQARLVGRWGHFWRKVKQRDPIRRAANLAHATSVAIFVLGGFSTFAYLTTSTITGLVQLVITIGLGWSVRWFAQRVERGKAWALWTGILASLVPLSVSVLFTVAFLGDVGGESPLLLVAVVVWLFFGILFAIPFCTFLFALRAYFANRHYLRLSEKGTAPAKVEPGAEL